MTKAELSRHIAMQTGLTIKEVTDVLENFFTTIKSQVINDQSVTIRGFGSFRMKHRKEKIARDISKGTEVVIPAKDVPSFRPSKQFLEL